eukprot:3120299-Pyramimonas_sp.AAC.1
MAQQKALITQLASGLGDCERARSELVALLRQHACNIQAAPEKTATFALATSWAARSLSSKSLILGQLGRRAQQLREGIQSLAQNCFSQAVEEANDVKGARKARVLRPAKKREVADGKGKAPYPSNLELLWPA